jgi:hypothetical protein
MIGSNESIMAQHLRLTWSDGRGWEDWIPLEYFKSTEDCLIRHEIIGATRSQRVLVSCKISVAGNLATLDYSVPEVTALNSGAAELGVLSIAFADEERTFVTSAVWQSKQGDNRSGPAAKIAVATPPPPIQIKLTRFEPGHQYTRQRVANMIGLQELTGNWTTGYPHFGGENFIFCNVGATSRTGHNYENRWTEGGYLIWYGSTGSKLSQPSIRRLTQGYEPVHIFWRPRDRDAFNYAGIAHANDVANTDPVEITWRFDTAPDAETASQALFRYRQGPPPHVGDRTTTFAPGPASVYVMALHDASRLFQGPKAGHILCKVGFSTDPQRRADQLNSGFPPIMGVSWRVVATAQYSNQQTAYEREQECIKWAYDLGFGAGGEFVLIPEDKLRDLSSIIQHHAH